MLNKEQIEKYADVMVWGMMEARTGRFKKGDIVHIRFDISAVELAEAIHRKLMSRGINVIVKCLSSETIEYDFYNISKWKYFSKRSRLIDSPQGHRPKENVNRSGSPKTSKRYIKQKRGTGSIWVDFVYFSYRRVG